MDLKTYMSLLDTEKILFLYIFIIGSQCPLSHMTDRKISDLLASIQRHILKLNVVNFVFVVVGLRL